MCCRITNGASPRICIHRSRSPRCWSAADELKPALRAATWRTLIGLLAVTGMRKSEACRLDRDHVNLNAATVVIEDSKFGKSRQLFLHPSTVAALGDYQRRRDLLMPDPSADSFFVSTRGTRLDVRNITHTFHELLDTAGIAAPPGRRRPRLHDLATASLSRHCWTSTATAAMSRPGFRWCRPGSVTSTRNRRTGICRPFRN